MVHIKLNIGSPKNWIIITWSQLIFCLIVLFRGASGAITQQSGAGQATHQEDDMVKFKAATEHNISPPMYVKMMLAKASNGLPEEPSTSTSSTGLSHLEEVGRFFRGGAPMGSDMMNRYFVYRYDGPNRWANAKIDHIQPVLTTTPTPALKTVVTSNDSALRDVTFSSPSSPIAPGNIPLQSATQLLPSLANSTSTTAPVQPVLNYNNMTVQYWQSLMNLQRRCVELPRRFAEMLCGGDRRPFVITG